MGNLKQKIELAVEKFSELPISKELKEQTQFVLKNSDEASLKSFFLDPMEFGTAGIRNTMGPGFNQINEYTIKNISQSIATVYQKESSENRLKIIIGFDTRNNSQFFAEESAKIFLLNSFEVFLFKNPNPVSLLTFGIKYHQADLGVMITASHNPKEYNGYKVYTNNAGQISDSIAKKISLEVNKLPLGNKPLTLDLSGAKEVNQDCFTSYYKTVLQYLDLSVFEESKNPLHMIYSSLFGTGTQVLKEIVDNYLNISLSIIEHQSVPNGNFPNLELPNPERKSVYDEALKYAQDNPADIIATTDPDADRIGIMAKNQNNTYTFLNGNEIGIIITYYLLDKRNYPENAFICTTLVSTDMIEKICHYFNTKSFKTLTGFKNIAQLIEQDPDNFIFGFEESHGFLIGNYIQDKDGISAIALLAEIAQFCKNQNKTLLDYLSDIYKTIGFYKSSTFLIPFNNSTPRSKIIETLSEVSTEFLGFKVLEKQDFYQQKKYVNNELIKDNYFENYPQTDLFIFYLEPHYKIAIRKSGTEPYIKVYLELLNIEKNNSESSKNLENLFKKNLEDLLK